MPIARRVGPIRPAIIFVAAMRTPQGLHSDSTVHPSTLEELQYQSLPRPLWVKSRHQGALYQCPLYPQKRTSVERVGMSALCQKRTSEPVATASHTFAGSLRAPYAARNARTAMSTT